MKLPSKYVGATLALAVAPTLAFAANHREAPITALDHKADITDVYAFRSLPGRPRAQGDADPRRRPAARARERAHPLPLRSGHPLRDQGRQRQRRPGRRDVPVPVPDGVPGAGPLHGGGGLRERGERARRRRTGGAAADRHLPERRPQPAPDLHGHHGAQRRIDPHRQRRRGALLRGARQCRPAHDGLPGAVQPRHLRPAERHLASSPAPPTTPSGSTSAPPSTPPTSARWAAAFRAC